MSSLFTELANKAKELLPEERAQLAEELLESLVEGTSSEVDSAWDMELQTRILKYEGGLAALTSAEDVFAEARRLTQ